MEILSELNSNKNPDIGLKVNGKDLQLQNITVRKILIFKDYMDAFSEGTISTSKLDELVEFLTESVFVNAIKEDFNDMNSNWFAEISSAMYKAMDITEHKNDLKAVETISPQKKEEVISQKPSQGSQDSTDINLKKS